jgi:hypothetical protein
VNCTKLIESSVVRDVDWQPIVACFWPPIVIWPSDVEDFQRISSSLSTIDIKRAYLICEELDKVVGMARYV